MIAQRSKRGANFGPVDHRLGESVLAMFLDLENQEKRVCRKCGEVFTRTKSDWPIFRCKKCEEQ